MTESMFMGSENAKVEGVDVVNGVGSAKAKELVQLGYARRKAQALPRLCRDPVITSNLLIQVLNLSNLLSP